MALTLRMARRGNKHRPFYHIVATDSRNPRDGSHKEQIGIYDPLGETLLKVDRELALKWLGFGATTSKTVNKLLRRAGVFDPAAEAPAAPAAASAS